MYAGGGALVDRLGTRRGLLVIMIGWSPPRRRTASQRDSDRSSSAVSCSASARVAFSGGHEGCRRVVSRA